MWHAHFRTKAAMEMAFKVCALQASFSAIRLVSLVPGALRTDMSLKYFLGEPGQRLLPPKTFSMLQRLSQKGDFYVDPAVPAKVSIPSQA
jgi:NAD(P)-dependent dehydrogenase (short-subunit alcohol dehydrogenase family)